MSTLSETVGRDLKSFTEDFGKVAAEFGEASGEPKHLCELLRTSLKDASLRVLGACMDKQRRTALKALVLDDLDGAAAERFCVVERVAETLRKAGIVAGSTTAAKSGKHRRPKVAAETNTVEKVAFEPCLQAGDGVPVAYVELHDTRGKVFAFREPLPSVTETAVMLIGAVARSYGALLSRGIAPAAMSESAIDAQREANVEVLRRVRAVCETLEMDWQEIVKDSESD